MTRSLRGHDFIPLPIASEAGTLTLADDLAAAMNDAPATVSPALVAALEQVREASASLARRIAVRERTGSNADPRARAADRAVDDAWGAFQCWLLGWTRLPDQAHPRIAEARSLYLALFPRGLQFLTLEFKDEWNESQQRLTLLAEGEHGSLVAELGGSAFLATLERTQRAYSEALQITSSRDPTAEEPDVQVLRSLDATHMAMREYIAQVAATVRRNDKSSVDLAQHLLLPISVRSTGAIDTADAVAGSEAWEAVDSYATIVSGSVERPRR